MPDNYVLLERIELNASAASVTFSNIPQTGYTDLKLVISGRIAVNGAYSDGLSMSVNGGTSYTTIELYEQNGTASSYGPRTGSTYLFLGHAPSVLSTANTFGSTEIYIPNYTSSNIKSVSVDGTTENNGTQVYQVLYAGKITNGTGISSITIDSFSANFVAGSSFSIYGVAALGTTPAIAPKANGGNVIATDGTYWYHAFLSNGTFTPQVGLTADVLVIAGGGAGAEQDAGGGGAGGIFYATSQALSTTGYTCTVGAGGSYSDTQYASGNSGNNSTFGSLTAALGGGGGAGTLTSPAPSGGSGGGGASTENSGGVYGSSTQTGTGGTGYGNRGGSGAANYAGGGGGGAGAVGSNATSGTGGAGGAGLNTWSSWATATSTGVSGYYGGGGGGAGGSSAAGGAGGGGASAVGGAAGDGVANTGGGGGGQRNYGSGSGTRAGSGGSGIIIIRYPIAS